MSEQTHGPAGRSCGTCLAWEPCKGQAPDTPPSIGQCRMHSPRPDVKGAGTFPVTYAPEWCLEFRPADSEQRVPVGEQKIRIDERPGVHHLHELAKDWDGKVRC